jgi:hypothetical protein
VLIQLVIESTVIVAPADQVIPSVDVKTAVFPLAAIKYPFWNVRYPQGLLPAAGLVLCVHVVPLVPGDVAIVFDPPIATKVLFPYAICVTALVPNDVVATSDQTSPSVDVLILDPPPCIVVVLAALFIPTTIATDGDAAAPSRRIPSIPFPQE